MFLFKYITNWISGDSSNDEQCKSSAQQEADVISIVNEIESIKNAYKLRVERCKSCAQQDADVIPMCCNILEKIQKILESENNNLEKVQFNSIDFVIKSISQILTKLEIIEAEEKQNYKIKLTLMDLNLKLCLIIVERKKTYSQDKFKEVENKLMALIKSVESFRKILTNFKEFKNNIEYNLDDLKVVIEDEFQRKFILNNELISDTIDNLEKMKSFLDEIINFSDGQIINLSDGQKLNGPSLKKIDKDKEVVVNCNCSEDLLLGPSDWLSDKHISFALDQISAKFKHIHTVDPLVIGICDTKLDIKKNTVMILHAGQHWVTLSNINAYCESNWILFDSLNDPIHLIDLEQFFKPINDLKKEKGPFVINTVNVQKQNGKDDCGLFAIAFAYELAVGKNPALLKFDQTKMRSHFNNCLKNGQLSSFPYTELPINSELSYKTNKLYLPN